MEKIEIKRVFKFGKLKLTDPNPKSSIKDVLSFYSGTYPELTNGHVEGPTIDKDEQVFEFKTDYKGKG